MLGAPEPCFRPRCSGSQGFGSAQQSCRAPALVRAGAWGVVTGPWASRQPPRQPHPCCALSLQCLRVASQRTKRTGLDLSPACPRPAQGPSLLPTPGPGSPTIWPFQDCGHECPSMPVLKSRALNGPPFLSSAPSPTGPLMPRAGVSDLSGGPRARESPAEDTGTGALGHAGSGSGMGWVGSGPRDLLAQACGRLQRETRAAWPSRPPGGLRPAGSRLIAGSGLCCGLALAPAAGSPVTSPVVLLLVPSAPSRPHPSLL